jgi:hypothetical protein
LGEYDTLGFSHFPPIGDFEADMPGNRVATEHPNRHGEPMSHPPIDRPEVARGRQLECHARNDHRGATDFTDGLITISENHLAPDGSPTSNLEIGQQRRHPLSLRGRQEVGCRGPRRGGDADPEFAGGDCTDGDVERTELTDGIAQQKERTPNLDGTRRGVPTREGHDDRRARGQALGLTERIAEYATGGEEKRIHPPELIGSGGRPPRAPIDGAIVHQTFEFVSQPWKAPEVPGREVSERRADAQQRTRTCGISRERGQSRIDSREQPLLSSCRSIIHECEAHTRRTDRLK